MIPITGDSSVGNFFEVIYNSELSPKTSRFSTTETIAMATSKVQLLLSSFRRLGLNPFWLPRNSRCLKSLISLMGPSRSSASSAVIVNWIFGENILSSPKVWFTRMFELRSLPTYTRYRSFMGRTWWPLSRINSPLGLTLISNLGNRCIDIKNLFPRVTDVLIFRS